MPRLQRDQRMSNRRWEMLSEKIGLFLFSKETPNRWPLFSLWLYGVDGIEVTEGRGDVSQACLPA